MMAQLSDHARGFVNDMDRAETTILELYNMAIDGAADDRECATINQTLMAIGVALVARACTCNPNPFEVAAMPTIAAKLIQNHVSRLKKLDPKG